MWIKDELFKIARMLAACFAACVLLNAPEWALPPERSLDQCRLDVWTARDGLPAGEITSIAQTPDGFIWLATSEGLIRFDGSSFYTFNSKNTPGLTTDLIRCLAVDGDGTLWLGTEWGGFGPFVDGRFKPCWPSTRHWHRVAAMRELPGGVMAVSVIDDSPEHTGIYRVVSGRVIAPASTKVQIPDFAVAGNGLICAMQFGGSRAMTSAGTLVDYGRPAAFAGKTVSCVAAGGDGSVWFGTEHDGLIRYLDGKYRFYTVREGLPSNCINCLFADREGRVWAGTNDGILTWDGHGFAAFGKVDGLFASNVTAISEDREGNLWVGSGFGLNRFAATKLVPFPLSANSIAAHVYGISSASNGPVWCASDSGIWKLLPSGAVHCSMPSGVPTGYADGVCAGPDGSLYLWLKNSDGSSFVYYVRLGPGGDLTRQSVARQVVEAGAAHTPAKIMNAACIADETGATFFGNGIMTRVERGVVVKRGKVDTQWEFQALRENGGDYWVACSNGLVRVHNGNSTRWNAGLPENTHVLGIEGSDPSCLWLATDKGLARFRNGRSTLFTSSDGLPDSNLFQIQRDAGGRLWIGCLHGLFTVTIADIDDYEQGRLKSIPCEFYTAADGICSYFDLQSSERTSDSRLWFAGTNGVTMVDPRHVAMNNFPPPVSIENADIDGITIPAGPETVSFPPGDGRLHIGFAALSFCAPEQVRFRYRLDGFDRGWVETNRRYADYTNLPPGSYRFDVIASNNDGIWNPVGASVALRLEPHYYQTIWFRALAVLLAIAGIAVAFAWRMRQVVRQNAALETIIAERTAELRMSHDQLQSAQEELTAQNHELETARDHLEQRVADRTRELEDAYDRTIEGWSFVMDLRDKETEGHSRRVTDVTVRMAEALGMTDEEIDNIRRGALLHDIGKMGVPDGVLLKPGPLNEEEWKVMRMHPVYAYEILSQIDYLKGAIDIPWCHHEKWDGTGYPRGLKGEEIPLAARMFCIVDIWDALRSDRPYRKGWPEERVFEHLRSLSGTHFEPEMVELFFRIVVDRESRQPEAKAA